MNRPFILCYMMTSIDGRIDCSMTGQLKGVDTYYELLEELDLPTTVSGRVTAELEMALPGKFESAEKTPIGKSTFKVNQKAAGYEVIVDSKGCLLWGDQKGEEKPVLILTTEKVSKEYLAYLDENSISYIACGSDKVDLAEACRILKEKFGVKRMGVVGGPTNNTAFLKEGLLDEIVLLVGAGIDGRANMISVFEGIAPNSDVIPLHLLEVRKYETEAVMLRYSTQADNTAE